jgi:LuxR family maltose regulon positive regulatory protein
VLARLHRRTQLVTEVDGDGRFRCHQLLREALLADLERNEADLRGTLQARAARWYAGNGDLDAAVRHAKAAGDLPLVSELVWSGILGCIGSGRPARLEVWLSGLTEHQVSSDAWLTLASAWAAMQSGEPNRMLRWRARSRVHAGRDWRHHIHSDEYAASLAVLETVVGAGGLEDSVALADGALVGLPADSGFRAVAGFIRGVSLTLLRRLEEGQASLREAKSLAGAFDVPLIEADALSWLGLLAMTSGDTNLGARLIGEASGVIEAHHLERLASSAHCLTAQAFLLAMTHRPDAEATLASARRLTALVPAIAPWFAVCGRLVQARAAILLNDGALARTLLADARRAMTPDLAASLAQDLLDATASSLESLSRDGVSGAALTAAEMRVLQFLPSHLTLPMIGEHLFLSPNTVKTHTLAIYRKFGVSSRSEAVSVAQSLGLVESSPEVDRNRPIRVMPE